MNIKDLTWDQSIYPRAARSQKTVSAYVEALGIHAQFPPIKIQRVFNYTDEQGNKKSIASIILDGIHRWTAFWVSASRPSTHGSRISVPDRKPTETAPSSA